MRSAEAVNAPNRHEAVRWLESHIVGQGWMLVTQHNYKTNL